MTAEFSVVIIHVTSEIVLICWFGAELKTSSNLLSLLIRAVQLIFSGLFDV